MADWRFPMDDEEEISSLYINVLVFCIILWIFFTFYIITVDLIVPSQSNSVWNNITKSNVLEYFFINVPLLHFVM
jgi:hypothetical protein